jgi:hypothetical protein
VDGIDHDVRMKAGDENNAKTWFVFMPCLAARNWADPRRTAVAVLEGTSTHMCCVGTSGPSGGVAYVTSLDRKPYHVSGNGLCGHVLAIGELVTEPQYRVLLPVRIIDLHGCNYRPQRPDPAIVLNSIDNHA